MRIGSHVSPDDPVGHARDEGADCVQIFLSNPRGWKPPRPRDDAAAIRAADLPVWVHAPYLVNPASGTPDVRDRSDELLGQTCDAAAAIGAEGVVVHGGHVTGDGSIADGVDRWVRTLERLESEVPILVENTAGGAHALARHLDELGRLWDGIGDRGVGLCLDTCHAHAAGEGLVDLVERIRGITGRIDLVHCNDSRDEAGSGRDRHAHLGHGRIDPDLLVATVVAADAPVICETAEAGRPADLAWLRERVGPAAQPAEPPREARAS